MAVEVGDVVCNDGCECLNAAINVRGQACYEQSFPPPPLPEDAPSCPVCAQVDDPSCGGVANPPARCINGLCTYCGDADPTECVNVDLSTYDSSCRSDSDCIAITSGVTCPGDWLCSNASINVDGQTRYEQTIALLPPVGPNFHCPPGPTPVCVQGLCTFRGRNQ